MAEPRGDAREHIRRHVQNVLNQLTEHQRRRRPVAASSLTSGANFFQFEGEQNSATSIRDGEAPP
jgi:hypothetical protein